MNQRLLQVLSGRNENFRPLFFFIYSVYILLFILSCSSLQIRKTQIQNSDVRVLTEDEMRQHNLNGIINEAKVCRNSLNAEKTALVVSGECEVVSCSIQNEILKCIAVPEKKRTD